MKVKVKLFDKQLMRNYFSFLSIASVILSFILIVIDIPNQFKITAGIVLLIILAIVYLNLWIKANTMSSLKLSINNSTVNIKVGDLFEECGFKVIAFNEYFDTLVDNRIISEQTLNGIFIKKYIQNLNELDSLIDGDERIKEKNFEINDNRQFGKKKKYKLGTICQYNDFLITAFSKFDNDNRAYLHMNDYINFLINFWNEIDIIYAGKSVSIPLLGSGITRFKEYNMISEQELLELLIWSFKVSRIKFTYPSQVTIIIHESIKDKIDFYKLKGCQNGL